MYLYIDENRENNTEKEHVENYESYLEDIVLEIENNEGFISGNHIVVGSEDLSPEILYDITILLLKRINGSPWINIRPQ